MMMAMMMMKPKSKPKPLKSQLLFPSHPPYRPRLHNVVVSLDQVPLLLFLLLRMMMRCVD
jgi:hypothetical protein